jgi:hypothetical protein
MNIAGITAPRLFIATFAVLNVTFGVGHVTVGAQGQPVIQTLPAPGIPGPPFYSNFSATFMPADHGTVGIAFYRFPSCVPHSFNLLIQIDAPAAFSCTLAVEGKRWWWDPAVDPFPFQIRYSGIGAVPIYFVSAEELTAAIADGTLTIGELQGLPSLLVGVATDFHQVIHNSNQAPGAEKQSNNKGHEELDAHGTILGTSAPFYFHYIEEFDPNTNIHTFRTVRIVIG